MVTRKVTKLQVSKILIRFNTVVLITRILCAAVLEFELRKAQDTIKSLRTSLTRSADTNIANVVHEEEELDGFAEDNSPAKYVISRIVLASSILHAGLTKSGRLTIY